MAGSEDQFVGRTVDIRKSNDQTISGTVVAIENGRLQLSHATVDGHGYDSVVVLGNEIADLKLAPLAAPAPATPQSPPPQTNGRTSTSSGKSSEKRPATPQSAGRSARTRNGRRGADIGESNVHQEFDFEANLSKFNKAEVFRDIKKNDTVPESERLASHNRNYKPSQMILERGDGASTPTSFSGRDGFTSPFGLVPTATPVQLVKIAQAMETHVPLAATTELAARGIADIAVRALGPTRFEPSNHNELPTVVVFVGNNTSGARALVAGRILAASAVTVIAVVVGSHADDETAAFIAAGGQLTKTRNALFKAISEAASPVELIIDGLQGFESPLADQTANDDELAAAQWLIEWANQQRAPVLAVDAPSGWDQHQAVDASWLACCGLPLESTRKLTHCKLFLVALSIPGSVFSQLGLRRLEAAYFGPNLVVPIGPQ